MLEDFLLVSDHESDKDLQLFRGDSTPADTCMQTEKLGDVHMYNVKANYQTYTCTRTYDCANTYGDNEPRYSSPKVKLQLCTAMAI